jgi:hypothetical protein
MTDLKGLTALVTGSTSGIGKAVAGTSHGRTRMGFHRQRLRDGFGQAGMAM